MIEFFSTQLRWQNTRHIVMKFLAQHLQLWRYGSTVTTVDGALWWSYVIWCTILIYKSLWHTRSRRNSTTIKKSFEVRCTQFYFSFSLVETSIYAFKSLFTASLLTCGESDYHSVPGVTSLLVLWQLNTADVNRVRQLTSTRRSIKDRITKEFIFRISKMPSLVPDLHYITNWVKWL